MVEQRLVTLSSRGRQIAAEEPIREALNIVSSDEDFYPSTVIPRYDRGDDVTENMVTNYLQGECFRRFSWEEKRQINRAIETDNRWVIFGEDPQLANLIDDKYIEKSFTKIEADNLLLSGIASYDLSVVSRTELLARYSDYGFADRLRFANFIGAALILKVEEDHTTAQDQNPAVFTYPVGDRQKVVTGIGGTMHGDFMLWQKKEYLEGAIDPIGNHHEFAPADEPTIVNAYHSVEGSLAIAALKHLDIRFRTNQQREQIAVVVELYGAQIKNVEPEKTFLFADYGARSEDLDISMMKHFFNSPKNYSERIWSNLLVSPGSDARLQVITQDEGLMLKKVSSSQPGSEVYSSVCIPDDMIPSFLIALLNQCRAAAGRTSDNQIINILKARYEMLTK